MDRQGAFASAEIGNHVITINSANLTITNGTVCPTSVANTGACDINNYKFVDSVHTGTHYNYTMMGTITADTTSPSLNLTSGNIFTIKLQRSNDGTNWSTYRTYYSYDTNTVINLLDINKSYDWTGIGYTIRFVVTGGQTGTSTSNTNGAYS